MLDRQRAKPCPPQHLARRQEPPPDRGARERVGGAGGLDPDGSPACGSRTSLSTVPADRNRRRRGERVGTTRGGDRRARLVSIGIALGRGTAVEAARHQEPPPDRGRRERVPEAGALDGVGKLVSMMIVSVRNPTSPSPWPASRNRRRIAARGSGSG